MQNNQSTVLISSSSDAQDSHIAQNQISDSQHYSISDFFEENNSGGGACLFKAFVAGYNRQFSTPLTHDEARQLACEYLQENEETVAENVQPEFARMKITNYKEYVDEMRKDATWGGYPELVGLCRKLKCQIALYHKTSKTFGNILDESESSDMKTIFLAYVKEQHVGHFTTLHRKPQTQKLSMDTSALAESALYSSTPMPLQYGASANTGKLFET